MRNALLSTSLSLFALAVASLAGCSNTTPKPEEPGDISINLAIEPQPPKVGPAEAFVVIRDRQNMPVKGATVKLEGNMNHAGMEPVFAEAKETDEPGRYKAEMKFTMGGDWFILVDASLPDGRKLHRKIDVPGVKRGG